MQKHDHSFSFLVVCSLGVFFSYFIYGILQETITKTKYGENKDEFTFIKPMLFLQCMVNATFAYIVLKFRREPKPHISQKDYALCAMSYIGAMFSSNASLRHVNYPTQVVGKSIKPIPVMLLSVLWARKRYSLKKYIFVGMITAGVILFMYKGNTAQKADAHGPGWGEVLLLISLGLDGLTGGMQEDFRSRKRVGPYNLMLSLNAWSLVYLATAIFATGELVPFITFVEHYPHVLLNILLFGVVSAIGQVAVDLRRFAYALDISNKRKDESNSTYGSHLERIAQAIMKLFQICAADSRTAIEDSKKRGMMGLANQLFKIYFQINKLNLCKPIIRAIENMNMDAYFSLAQRITFNYYVGRKAMFDGDFKMANTCLTFAFERCLASHHTNKRLILIYLIPVRMLLGIFPRNSLLQKYKLQELEGIANAARTGNVQKLGEELQRYEGFFISCGIYLILEKLKMLTYRNLFKKVAGLLKTHLQPIPAFTDILKVMGVRLIFFMQNHLYFFKKKVEDIDTDETECILANLIYEVSLQKFLTSLTLINGGKIKGYLAHQQQKLVVSKVQAFPPL
ncbi:unnamed protein product [Mesocestoides corti]|uniref:PCI domain-containing protein n=1 Tax=Mesocestoides corti TaxID=53468 RepID=A0A0R3UH30_MESCO|nr:unnamed protein product [Mesocestoides corti]